MTSFVGNSGIHIALQPLDIICEQYKKLQKISMDVIYYMNADYPCDSPSDPI